MLNSNNIADVMQIAGRLSEKSQTSVNKTSNSDSDSFKSKLEGAQKDLQKKEPIKSDSQKVNEKNEVAEKDDSEAVNKKPQKPENSKEETKVSDDDDGKIASQLLAVVIPEIVADVQTVAITDTAAEQNANNAQETSQAVLPTTTLADNTQILTAHTESTNVESAQVKPEVTITLENAPTFNENLKNENSQVSVKSEVLTDEVVSELKPRQTSNDQIVDFKEIKSQMESESLVKNVVVKDSGESNQNKQQTATESQKETKLTDETEASPNAEVLPQTEFKLKLNSEPVTTSTEKPVFTQAEQITKNLMAAVENGKQEFTMQLEPESLGKITVKLVLEGGKLSLDVVTSNPRTQGILSDQIAGLKEILAKNDYQINDVNISNNGQHMYQGFSDSFTSSDTNRQNSSNKNYNGKAFYNDDLFEDDQITPILTDISSLRMRMNYVV